MLSKYVSMAWAKEVAALRDGKDPPNSRLTSICDVLKRHGKATVLQLTPDQLAPHPQNRGGRMCVASDCHKNGAKIVTSGAKFDRIGESISFEMPQDPNKCAEYIAKLNHLVSTSQEMLAPLSGAEVGLTIGSTNTTSFCRAAMANCKTNQPELANSSGRLNSPASYGGEFGPMCTLGWKWLYISRDVEECFPDLPGWMSYCLNNTNVAMKPKEIESAISLARLIEGGTSFHDAVREVQQSHPECEKYITEVATYAQNFSGGKGWPLLVGLDNYVKILGCTSCMLGEEFMSALVNFKPKSLKTTFPFLRLACWLTQATSPKVVDGISKLLVVNDMAKLKATKLADLEAVELLLSQGWDLGPNMHKTEAGNFEPEVLKAYGKFATRTVVHVVQKEKQSLEPAGFESLNVINEAYQAFLSTGKDADKASAGAASDAAGSNASSSQNEGPAVLASLADCKNVAALVLAKYTHLKLDSSYAHKDFGQNVFKFIEINDTVGVFECTPVFGQKIKVETLHQDLKKWTKVAKQPALIPKTSWEPCLPAGSNSWKAETSKAQATLALNKFYAENSLEDDIELCKDPELVCLRDGAETYQKGEIVLVPLGSLRAIENQKETQKLSASKLIKDKDGKAVYSIIAQPKKVDKKTELVVPATWVTASKVKSEINMEVKYVSQGSLQFPTLQNTRAVKAREKLVIAESKPAENKPADSKPAESKPAESKADEKPESASKKQKIG